MAGLMTMMPRIGIFVVGAVQLESGSAEGLAVNLDLLGALRVFVRRVRPAEKLCAGKQELQIGKVLVAYGKTGNLLLIEDGRDVGARRSSVPAGYPH